MKKILIAACAIAFLTNSEILCLFVMNVAGFYGLYKLFAYAADNGKEI